MSEITSAVIVLPAALEHLAVLETELARLLAQAPPLAEPDVTQYNLQLATHELCVNIIEHAYGGESGEIEVIGALLDDPWRVEITTLDRGRHHFDLQTWAPPDLDDLPVHGLGIFLMHNLMDTVTYTPEADCSRWHLLKRLDLAADPAGYAAGVQQAGPEVEG